MSESLGVNVIAGDIGGTKTLLRLVSFDPARPLPRGKVLFERRFESRAHPDLETMLRAFRDVAPKPAEIYSACLGVAGPVQGDIGKQSARLTNLPWKLESQRLTAVLDTQRVLLVNDFQAVGYGIDALERRDIAPLQVADPRPRAARLILGAGTGLGVALMFWNGSHYECYPTEGGHIHFAPTDGLQSRLLEFLQREFGRVSNERLLSGPGLVNLYRFLLTEAGGAPDNDPLLREEDPAAAISSAADAGAPDANRALDLFVTLYGQIAGDLALTCLAEGGVYVAGGIAPKILHRLNDGRFIEAFRDKGRMRAVVERMPVQVVLNTEVAMLGTALAASRL